MPVHCDRPAQQQLALGRIFPPLLLLILVFDMAKPWSSSHLLGGATLLLKPPLTLVLVDPLIL